MRGPTIAVTVAIFSWALCHTTGAAEAPDTPQAIESLYARLKSNAPEHVQAFNELSSQREIAIYALIRIVMSDDEPFRTRKTRAMELLGEFRARRACRYLIQQFDFVGSGLAEDSGGLGDYPAAEALLRIGEPGILMIIGETPRWETDEQFRRAAYFLKKYYHPEEEVGLFRLQWYLKQIEDPKSKGPFRPKDGPKMKRLIHMYESIDLGNPKHAPNPRRHAEQQSSPVQ